MTTLNISMPESMRNYVEAQATQGHYSASEYVRHLIRRDQTHHEQEEHHLLWDYLALSAKQLDEGDFSSVNMKGLLSQGRKRRSQAK